jgi:regulatory protein
LAKIEAARLRLGQELSEADIARLQAADAREQVHARALRYLAIRPRSEGEVRQHLQKHKVGEAEIEQEIQRLRQSGLVDDQAFARLWVENRAAFRPRSQRALRVELKRKGVSPEALKAALTKADDAASAEQLAARRAPRLARLPHPEFRRKLGDYLARRGFDYDTVQAAVEQAWQTIQGQSDDT